MLPQPLTVRQRNHVAEQLYAHPARRRRHLARNDPWVTGRRAASTSARAHARVWACCGRQQGEQVGVPPAQRRVHPCHQRLLAGRRVRCKPQLPLGQACSANNTRVYGTKHCK